MAPIRRTAARRTTTALLAIGALSTALLAGCSAIDPNGKPQACLSLKDPAQKAVTDVSEALQGITTDPQAAADQVRTTKDDLQKAVDKVKNDEVKASSQKVVDALGDLETAIDDRVANPANLDTSALTDAGTSVQTTAKDLVDLCASSLN
ncbi:hypothetical protein GCM10027515_16480 [Schumannella luteola]|uniref:Outer membrane murein-binding lipoprotein Lpp n=1 Tax=Schumannella luteola TaxID=472059 RepID=A0A852YFL7_9MICO|nr:hypothetical protein [Schumannella luteola]NYH00553.1 outer membrane murein-binding lipoprotein Lpp [Schumannella luteola]TPW91022.1 hypothetical protein FJ656_36280 [Schumannella luteola]